MRWHAVTVIPRLSLLLLASWMPWPVSAQVPNVLTHSWSHDGRAGFAGDSVAVDGRVAVVGVPLDNTGALKAGSVRVYETTTGRLLHHFHNPAPDIADMFGCAVAVSGMRVLVGADADNTGAEAAAKFTGSAYLYHLHARVPEVPFTLANPQPGDVDAFGCAVAITGARAVVGASNDQVGSVRAGSVHVFETVGNRPPRPVARLDNPTPDDRDCFGATVAISGNFVVVGARHDDTGGQDAGCAYVFDLAGRNPTIPAFTLTNPSPSARDYFGAAVAISGTKVAVGTPAKDTGASNAGCVYVYDLTRTTPTIPLFTLPNPTPASEKYYGAAVAISGPRVVVGMHLESSKAVNAGAAYVYDLRALRPAVPVATLFNPAPAFDDRFGRAVALDGLTIVVGAPDDDTLAREAGSAYVFQAKAPP